MSPPCLLSWHNCLYDNCTIIQTFCPYKQYILYNFYTFNPNSSGLKRGHTFSVDVITDAANVVPI